MSRGLRVSGNNGRYFASVTQKCWEAWQYARETKPCYSEKKVCGE